MLAPYRSILTLPGAKAFAFAGLLSRLPISMFNISVILMVQIQYSSYAIAGRVAAVGVLVWALQTVPTARLVDRIGQRAAMIPLTITFVAGASLAIWTAMTQGPEWLLWLAVAIASIQGPLGSLTRARWSHLLERDQDIHTAFALEGSLDEVLFVAGPAAATILATTVWPPLGVVVCLTGLVIGMTILLAQRATEPAPRRGTGGTSLGLRLPGAVIGVAFVSFGIGAMFGAFDISVVAFADESGHKTLSGLIIGIISAGSLVGGLLYGARHWRSPLWKRTLIGAAALAIGFGALALAPNVLLLSLMGFVAGATIAPTMTNADAVVQRVVRRDQITEGMAWLRIGLGVGVALGAWVAGGLIESVGSRAGLAASAAGGLLSLVLALAFIGVVRRDTERGRPTDEASLDAEQEELEQLEETVEQPPIPPHL
ncbi:MFS transporter [Demequina lignilytica]|uniref:MFS transporter n=1 Tax=Demequina lignilytica TaxID=3051663 RepID=A0AB35MHQ3_9MICO|nr:MFS transporter [Demequina sp. SYSU T0a273]MDN4483342.1 MFS transporter [Demequina sp. SYSU T0a273]